ncbi:hypothetical protein E4T65_30440 [Pseudomonas fluorescens]|uniref:Uncharacterized protein n=1 Tax=Pseudomonas fluorescens TaxID=294 RepID=A0A4Y9SZI0_PSEFL|nr:hypothetical protein E4T65_30440 [Pseudomonas fluorescens]
MVVNDNDGSLTPRGALRFFASRLAPTGEECTTTVQTDGTVIGIVPPLFAGAAVGSETSTPAKPELTTNPRYETGTNIDPPVVPCANGCNAMCPSGQHLPKQKTARKNPCSKSLTTSSQGKY